MKRISPTSAATIADDLIIGVRSVIWHFVTILSDVVIGDDVSIGSHTEIGRGSRIGDRTRISAMVFLPSHSTIGNDVFIGPGVIFTDDRYPRVLKSGEHYKAEPPVIEDDANIGAGSVILPGVRIGRGALIGAGSVVTRDVPPMTLVRGDKARQRAFTGLTS